ncbi:nucleoside phosphorylase domain-containing protein [Aspergillus sergii]|uniref:Nucleoside phosphorylase domain-containing protein n=1 Tax=Aspergillus sergii TaxID=1034303 RepID=A0A5N6WUK6_9EURO|nr:nucleoside phosphorylase domain-containing protein [Aspergillus sergii]
METTEAVSKMVFDEINTASKSDDLRILLHSHLSQTCGQHLKDLKDLGSPSDKYKRYLVKYVARGMVEHVIRQFPINLAKELVMSSQSYENPLQCADYKVGWVCALPLELAAATSMLDTAHGLPVDFHWQPRYDHNQYSFGQIGTHNVVLAVLPAGTYGTTQSAIATKLMTNAFPGLHFVLMVGIGGGVPSKRHDIRLGDVVVSKPVPGYCGVLQYDFGKMGPNGEVTPTGVLNKPPPEALTAIAAMDMRYMIEGGNLTDLIKDALSKRPKMKDAFSRPSMDKDTLFKYDFDHIAGDDCMRCPQRMIQGRPQRATIEPTIHYGLIGSGNQVIKDGRTRERLRQKHDILCFEMEAAGMMDTISCLVVRGICDYADSHKNKLWQKYAAMTAAAYAKDLLHSMGTPAISSPKLAPLTPTVAPVSPTPALLHRRNPEPRPSQSPPIRSQRAHQQLLDPQLRVSYGKRLLWAAQNRNMPLVKAFLEKGGDPNTADPQWNLTALHYTAKYGDIGTTRLLLKAGADPDVPIKFTKNTPLFEAASRGHDKVAQCLLQHKANIMSVGKGKRTALHAAAANGHLACVTVLMEAGADSENLDKEGYTPLDLAEKEGHSQIAKYLRGF